MYKQITVLFVPCSGHQSVQQWLLATRKPRAQRKQSTLNGFPAAGQIWKQAESHHQENTGKQQLVE